MYTHAVYSERALYHWRNIGTYGPYDDYGNEYVLYLYPVDHINIANFLLCIRPRCDSDQQTRISFSNHIFRFFPAVYDGRKEVPHS